MLEPFIKLFNEGGWVLYPIFSVSIVVWHIAGGKFLRYTWLKRAWNKAHASIVSRSAEGTNKSGYAPFDTFVARVLSPTATPAKVERAFEELLVETTPGLDRGITTISACVVMAPLLGLLGTISGMNEMFRVIGEFGFGNPTIMANGISMALQATLTGMAVAVAALFSLDYLTNTRHRLVARLRGDRDIIMRDILKRTPRAENAKKGGGMRHMRSLHEEHQNPEINLAPFVDTIMILLIFFVVTANLYVETGVDVSKPKAQAAKAAGAKALLIGITREGTVHMMGRQVSVDRLRMIVEQEVGKQPDVSVVIIADRDANVGKAVEVLDQCTMAGVQKVSIAAGKD